MAPSLYTFSSETLSGLQKFRFASAKSTSMQAIIYEIDKSTYEIKREDDEEIYTSIEDLVEELPDTLARYILLSYPFKLPDGRLKSPLVLIYWRPPTTTQASKMLYAGAVELFKDKASVSKFIEASEEEDLEDLEKQLA